MPLILPPFSQLRPNISNLCDKDWNSSKSRFGKGWSSAPKQVFPIVLTPKPSNHKGGNPFLVGAFGTQYCSSSPSSHARIEYLWNCRALEGPSQQNANKPHEPRCISQSDPLSIAPGSLNASLDNILVGSCSDPHSLGPKKLVGIPFSVPPIFVNTGHAIFGKEPKDPQTSGSYHKSKELPKGQFQQEQFQAMQEFVLARIEHRAGSGVDSIHNGNLFWFVSKISKGIEYMWL